MPSEPGQEPLNKITAPTSKRHRLARSSRWWLALAIFISVFVHLLVGIGGQQLGLFGEVQKPPQPEDNAVELTLLAQKPVTKKEQGDKSAPQKPALAPITPSPTPRPVRRTPTEETSTEQETPATPLPPPIRPVTPTPVEPSPAPIARPIPKQPKEGTPLPVTPDRAPMQTVITPQVAIRTPATGNPLPGRLPEPLPPGDIAGASDTPNVTRETRRPTTVRIAAAPKRAPEADNGHASGETRPSEENNAPASPASPSEVKTGDAGEGGTRGDARGGRTAAIGIDRGIPFGDKLGIYGGNPAGGGAPRSPAPAAVDASISNEDGKFRVSLKRSPSSESGSPPLKIAYVLDVSWSMNSGGKMNRAHEALHKALDELRPDDQFTIVTFSNDARSSRMLSATRAGLSIGHANVEASVPEPGGNTNLSSAIDLALGLPGITHIFILSDGEPTEGITDPDELLAFTRKKNIRKARIITMALVSSEDKKGFTLLKEIAEQHNGLFDFVDVR